MRRASPKHQDRRCDRRTGDHLVLPIILDLATLRALYADRQATQIDVIKAVITRRAAWPDKAVFITPASDNALHAATQKPMERYPEPNSLPLWGIPFAVKDNIDMTGLPTTAACPAYAYEPAGRRYRRPDCGQLGRLLSAKPIWINAPPD